MFVLTEVLESLRKDCGTHSFVMIMEQNTACASGELELLAMSDSLLSLKLSYFDFRLLLAEGSTCVN